ncbi:MAG: hypothetical protein RQ732_02710 [Methylophaga sp.]|nr:hypothetical protein [Methylophaga sp.]
MKHTLITLLLLCWLMPAFAVSSMHTIELQHRTPAEVLPEIQALLPENAAVSSFDNTLILRSDGATFEDVRRVLDVLDKPQQSINITLLRSQEQLNNRQHRDSRLVIDSDSAGVELNRWSTRDNRNRDMQLQAHGLAGEPVQINTGQLITQREQLVLIGPHGGVGVQNVTRYLPIDNGFQALVSVLSNKQLRIELFPTFAEFDRRSGDIDRSSLLTTVNAKSGEWLLIGRTGDSEAFASNQTQYHSHRDNQQFIYMKVELN